MSVPSSESPDLLLLSGGIDSGALLAQRHAAGQALRAVWVDYGQRNAEREWTAVEALANAHECDTTALDLRSLRTAFARRNDWVGHVPLPQRNLLVLALAINLAEHQAAGRVLLALNRDDQGHGAGSAQAFVRQVSGIAATLVPGLAVEAPLIGQSKADIIRATTPLGIDWRRTWSCLLAQPRHCSRCPQCRARQAAFGAAGIPDPTDYRNAPP
ncbi:MAG: 7-cyano-7-deazaguanine synthase [Thioalkalivibrio sp.]|nr:7-cyano-7-deazaguanine synthase [Thioalkalivibrio sp.]